MGLPIERKLQGGFGVVVIIMATIGVVSYRSTRRLVEASHHVFAYSQEVLAELQATRTAKSDLDSAIRGYVLNGDQQNLQQYESAAARINEHLRHLQQLTADNSQQQNQIVIVAEKVAERIHFNQEIIEARKTKGAKAASQVVATGNGRAMMHDIGVILGQLSNEQNGQMRRQAENWERSASNSILTVTLLVLIAIMLFSAAHYLLLRHIGARRRAEEALRESKERYRELFENASDIVFTTDLEGNITSANRAAEELTGYSRTERNRISLAQLLAPEYLGLARQMLDGKLTDQKPTTYELEIVAKDGRRVPLEISARLTYRDGKPVGVQGIARDITNRKRAEETLRDGEMRFRSLFEEAPVAYHEIDRHGVVQRVNRAECILLGFDASEILGKPIWEFVAKEERETSREAIRRKVNEQQALLPLQREYVRRDGRRLMLEIHENLIRDKMGAIVGIRSTLLDITERNRTEHELERRTSEIAMLSELGSLLQACLSTEEAYSVIARFAPKLFPTAPGAVCVLSASRNLVESVAVWGDAEAGEHVFAPDDCWALRSGRLHFVEDPKSPLLCRHVSQAQGSSFLCVPMMAQGDALGVLHIHNAPRDSQTRAGGTGESVVASKQRLAMTLAEQIGLALANLKLRETLRIQSIRDRLTGLYNRRYMEESLERELRRAARNNGSLGAVMLDLDHFKRYNDTFGHEAGDTLLRELGNFLQAQVRGEDIACRYGGEEFVLILPDATLEGTVQRAEQLREGIKHLNVQHRGAALGPVTLSAGVAVFPDHGAAADALFRAADEALYQAKADGRDRVVIGKFVQRPEPVS